MAEYRSAACGWRASHWPAVNASQGTDNRRHGAHLQGWIDHPVVQEWASGKRARGDAQAFRNIDNNSAVRAALREGTAERMSDVCIWVAVQFEVEITPLEGYEDNPAAATKVDLGPGAADEPVFRTLSRPSRPNVTPTPAGTT